MKSTLLALALTTVLTSAALAQSVGEKTGVNSALGITPKTEDFIKEGNQSWQQCDRTPKARMQQCRTIARPK
jgi:hypothetical protein